MEDELLTVAEVAELLRLNQQTVRNWIDDRYLPAVRVGRRVRIRRADLCVLLEKSVIVPRAPRPDPPNAAREFWTGELELLPETPTTDEGS